MILTIYIFFAGWIYQDFYLESLGISPSAVDIPYHATLAFAANVFTQPLAIPQKLLALVGFGIIATLCYRKKGWRFYLLITTLVALFPVIQWVAYTTAREMAHDRLTLGPFRRIKFALREHLPWEKFLPI